MRMNQPISIPGIGRLEGFNSREVVLQATAFSFLLFVIAEHIASELSNSLSLLGDAFAMTLDVAAYVASIFAERLNAERAAMRETTKHLVDLQLGVCRPEEFVNRCKKKGKKTT